MKKRRLLTIVLVCSRWMGGNPCVGGTTYYVWTNSPSDGPGTNWATAFHVLQAGVDAARDGDTVLVTNGVYDQGGALTPGGCLTNRVVVTNALRLESVNGPEHTLLVGLGVKGDAAIRCAYLTSNAVLSGFTLTNGHTTLLVTPVPDACGGGVYGGHVTNCVLILNMAQWGGGASHSVLRNCRIAGNDASDGSGVHASEVHDSILSANGWYDSYQGGGADSSVLERCTLRCNTVSRYGGGAYGCTLRNCVVISNAAVSGDGQGGGAYASTLLNCLVVRNQAEDTGAGLFGCVVLNCTVASNGDADNPTAVYGARRGATNSAVHANLGPNWANAVFHYSCTTPDPGGEGNITNDPRFVNADAGDLRLAPNSPCIDRGTNQEWMGEATDLDGMPRVIHNRVDMGAYEALLPEWDTDGDGIPDWWEWQYGRVLTNLEAGADLDGDGAPNVSEYGADTNPTNAASVLRFLAIRRQWGGVRLDWQGGTGACQYLECRQQLDSTNGPWDALLGIPPPTPVTNAVIDLGATNAALFYRIRAERE